MNDTNVSPNFQQYALSYSGMDGGNPDAPLWICGIEFGGELAGENQFTQADKIPCWTDASREASINKAKATGNRQDGYKMWPFCRLASKLTVAVMSGDISEWRQHYYSDSEQKGYCGACGCNFSLNLYPINFRRIGDAGWNDDLRCGTGFASRHHYRAWCVEHRFRWLQKLMSNHKPSAVVCCAAAETRDDFARAFCGRSPQDWSKPFSTLDRGRKRLSFFKLNGIVDGTTVWIVPFLGQGGLLRDDDIKTVGGWIRADILKSAPNRLSGFWPLSGAQ